MPRTDHSATEVLLGTVVLALVLAGCGNDPANEGSPGALRIARAMAKGLFSNSVSATEREAESPPPVPALPDPEPTPAPLASLETDVPQTCAIAYSGPVTIIPVRSAGALARSVWDRPERDLVYETEDTVIFEDGRVLTLDLENVGTHLNAVGWSTNPMKILGAGVRPGGSARNVGWNSAENTQNTGKRGKKKRQRRG